MEGKRSIIQELEQMLAEYKEKLRPDEWVKSRLRWEDWTTLQPEVVQYAKGELRRRGHGRLAVLPAGYDAESIAAEAVSDMLEGKSRLGPGWIRSRLVKELKRLIQGKIRRLEMRKEAMSTSNERTDDSEEGLMPVAVEGHNGYHAAVAREQQEQREQFRREVEAYLEHEPELARVFGCQWEGMINPAEIGRRLGMDEQAVKNARKKLERRLVGWRKSKGSWSSGRNRN